VHFLLRQREFAPYFRNRERMNFIAARLMLIKHPAARGENNTPERSSSPDGRERKSEKWNENIIAARAMKN
jgi:hypothetical protein